MTSASDTGGGRVGAGVPTITEVTYINNDGYTVSLPPDPTEATFTVPAMGVRKIRTYMGATNTAGKYWTQTGNAHLPYESYLESRWLQLMDYDATVTYIMTQPFRIAWAKGSDTHIHRPDVFLRRVNGAASIVDVVAPRRRQWPEVIQAANITAVMCKSLGWTYHLVTNPPEPMSTNVDWLSGFRRLQPQPDLVTSLLAACDEPITLADLWRHHKPNLLAKPATFHLLWKHQLELDLTQPMRDDSVVWRAT